MIVGLYFLNHKMNGQNHELGHMSVDSQDSSVSKSADKTTTAVAPNKIHDNHKDNQKQNHNTIHDPKLKVEDFIIDVPDNEETQSLKSIFTQISKINLEESTLKELSKSFDKIDLETEFTVDRNELTGNFFFLKSKNQIPGTRYLHGQLVGEGSKKFIQHLSFEYKGQGKSFNESISIAQSLIGNDQKPSVISENYIQWKISETHILWVKRLTEQELLDDPIYPHSKEDLGTIKIAIEQEIH